MSPFLDDYEPVEDRLRAFHEDHPYGRVLTELLPERNAGEYIVLASVFLGSELRNDPPAATGLASEFTGTSNVNKTSALENCETSAIGRALANLGYAPKGKRPSREEMSKVSAASPSKPSADRAGGIPTPSQVTSPPPPDVVAADPKRSGEVAEDAAATAQQWERLMAVSGGSLVKAVNRLNKANQANYTKATAVVGASSEEVALAITGGAA